ncbi:MAG: nicotinate (nicotinamide) nucleotide adenylyltransferase [Magnetococcales bacterium]|nr:nicotinate (nicotinamide) nucleotide adenylyltransferase [Magnetococcales bacterium]
MRSGKKRKTGVLGGAFNPPHFGHLRPAQEVMELLDMQQVLFLPSGGHPLKKGSIVAANHRLAMAKVAIANTPKFTICDLDVKRSGISYSVDTLAELARLYPDFELVFMVGGDILTELHLWKDYHKILDHAHLLMMVRPGVETDLTSGDIADGVRGFLQKNLVEHPEELDAKNNGFYGFIQIPVTPVDISATQIRAMVAKGMDCKKHTPDGVVDYIMEHGLYLT